MTREQAYSHSWPNNCQDILKFSFAIITCPLPTSLHRIRPSHFRIIFNVCYPLTNSLHRTPKSNPCYLQLFTPYRLFTHSSQTAGLFDSVEYSKRIQNNPENTGSELNWIYVLLVWGLRMTTTKSVRLHFKIIVCKQSVTYFIYEVFI